MKESEKKEITDFKNFYHSLTNNKKAQLRNKIMDGCGFSLATFYYKLANGSFKKLEIKRIEEIVVENWKLFR